MLSIYKLFIPLLLIITFILSGCSSNKGKIHQKKLYTRHNIWYEKPQKIYGINYKKGNIIPIGTEIELLRFGRGRIDFFEFKVIEWDKVFRVHIEERYQPNHSIQGLYAQMVTDRTFEELTFNMKSEVIQAIKDGRVIKGMSKGAVILSLGYPPRHKTPNTAQNIWLYWKDRFNSFIVQFDEKGHTLDKVVW